MNATTAPALRPLINVASAALFDHDGRLLLTQRPEGKRYAGWWELPGGKLEFGELPAAALSREIMEELGIKVETDEWQPVTFVAHDYSDLPTQALVLIHAAHRWQGEPQSLERQAFKWVAVEELASYRLLPTMQAALPALQAHARRMT